MSGLHRIPLLSLLLVSISKLPLLARGRHAEEVVIRVTVLPISLNRASPPLEEEGRGGLRGRFEIRIQVPEEVAAANTDVARLPHSLPWEI